MKKPIFIIAILIITLGVYPLGLSAIPNPNKPLAPQTTPDSFQALLKLYRAKELTRALTEVKRLEGQGGIAAEVAMYLLGEIYLNQADKGDLSALPQSMIFFKKAVSIDPQSEHALFGYLRIGEIYARQKLFQEAIGNFKRVVDQPFASPFKLQARIQMARTYHDWGKWEEARAAYQAILQSPSFSVLEKSEAQLSHADVRYQMGQFEAAYQLYKKAALFVPSYRFHDPVALFQFGEAAYRSHHFNDAKRLFLKFYNLYPREPLAPVALIRFDALLKLNQPDDQSIQPLVTPNLDSIDETIDRIASGLNRRAKGTPAHLGKILLSLKALQTCNKPQATCSLPLVNEAFLSSSNARNALREAIHTDAMNLLATPLPSTTAQGMLLEAIAQLKQYDDPESVMEIETALLTNLPRQSPYRQEIENSLNKTLVKQMGALEDPMAVVTLFHRYSEAFTEKMLAGEAGFVIAESHADIGLISRAAELYLPITKNFKDPVSNEALYRLGKIYLQLGETENAQQALEQYRKRTPKGQIAFSDLGDIYFEKGDTGKAILLYEHWLSRYSDHPERTAIYRKLAAAHRYRNDFDNEIKVYLKWIKNPNGEEALPYPELADAYFQSGQYEKAIGLYQSILHQQKGGMEWAQLRMAMSYESLGQTAEGKRLFKKIAKRAKDPLIKQMAETRL